MHTDRLCRLSEKHLDDVSSTAHDSHLLLSYQFYTSKASNSKSIDDVEVCQLQAGVEGILSLIPE